MSRAALRNWRQDRKIDDSFVWLASHSKVNSILSTCSKSVEWESGFFRIEHQSLNQDIVRESTRLMVTILSSYNGVFDLAQVTSKPSPLTTQRDGHLLAYMYFKNFVAFNRSRHLESALEQYVEQVILPHDIHRRRWRWKEPARAIALQIEEEMKQLRSRPREVAKDLVDVAISCTNNEKESAEILRRLILSTVGFLGSAVEWLLIDLAQEVEVGHPASFVKESLRFHSPAWRLSRQAAVDFQIAGIEISKGQNLLLNLHAANRDPKIWLDGDKFLPQRWQEELSNRNSLTFGKGSRICPAQRAAMSFLELIVSEISQGYEVNFSKRPMARMKVATLAAPPRGIISLNPIS